LINTNKNTTLAKAKNFRELNTPPECACGKASASGWALDLWSLVPYSHSSQCTDGMTMYSVGLYKYYVLRGTTAGTPFNSQRQYTVHWRQGFFTAASTYHGKTIARAERGRNLTPAFVRSRTTGDSACEQEMRYVRGRGWPGGRPVSSRGHRVGVPCIPFHRSIVQALLALRPHD
jgi:hypothetical protein